MATFSSVFPTVGETCGQIASLGTVTPSSSIIMSAQALFVITTDQNMSIRFGSVTSIANAAATDFPLWANSNYEFEMPNGCDRFRVFNTSGSTGNAWYWQLSRS